MKKSPSPEPTENTQSTPAAEIDPRAAHVRAYLAVRIQDYRLQALAYTDPDDPALSQVEWADLGTATAIDTDRDTIYQAARANGGLLLPVQGLCTASGMRIVQEAAKVLVAAHIAALPPRQPRAASFGARLRPIAPTEPQDDKTPF